MIYLSEADVDAVLDLNGLVDAIRAGFEGLASGASIEPPATRIDLRLGEAAYLTAFPTVARESGFGTTKVIAGRPANAKLGRPEIDGVIVAADLHTGSIIAILAAKTLTALRTAATSVVAIETLAAGSEIGDTGIIGTGRQGLAHARVLAARGFRGTFLVASAEDNDGRARAFAERVAAATRRCAKVVTTANAAEAPVVITATLSPTPIIKEPGPKDQIIVGVGPFYPDATEIDRAVVAAADLVVSDHPGRLTEQWAQAGTTVTGLGRRLIGLDALVRSEAVAPAHGRRIFLSDGRGLEDNVAASLVISKAVAACLGLPLA